MTSSSDLLAAAVSSPDPLTTVASPTDLLANASAAASGLHGQWFDVQVYDPLHAGMERWTDSPFGTRVDDFINHFAGQDLIGNGADGTAASPDGGDAGLWFGDGGDGYGPTGDGGDAGWIMGNGGDAGSATDGGAGAATADPAALTSVVHSSADPNAAATTAAAERPINGATGAHGGNAGRVLGDGGNGANGTDGQFGGTGGDGGTGGSGGSLGGVGGNGGHGGAGGDGTTGGNGAGTAALEKP